MSYYFECTYCHYRQEVDLWGDDVARNCDVCGEDMCNRCIHSDGCCDGCFAATEDDEEEE